MKKTFYFVTCVILLTFGIVLAENPPSSWVETYNLSLDSYIWVSAHPDSYYDCPGTPQYRLTGPNNMSVNWTAIPTSEGQCQWSFQVSQTIEEGEDPDYTGWDSKVIPAGTGTLPQPYADNGIISSNLTTTHHQHLFYWESLSE